MGFLSSLLTIGGAIAGSFVGQPGIGAAIGGAIGGAVDQSSASSDAAAAQVQAQKEAAAERAAAAAQVGTLQAPYVQAGYTGLNALTSRLGLNPTAVNSAISTAQAASPVGTPASGNALAPSASAPNLGIPSTVNALAPVGIGMAQDFTRTAGQGVAPDPSSTIANPPMSVAPTQAPQTVPLTTAGPQPNALAPSSSATPSAAYPVTNGTDPGTFGDTSNPVQPAAYTAPTPFSYGLSDYTASPAYAYQQDQARKATLAGASATGALQSGAAMKALQDRAQNIAYQDFTNERGFAAGQNQLSVTNALNAYDTNQNVYDNNRNYLTNRFDTQTGNLFKYTGAGQQAADTVGNADMGIGAANANGIVAAGNAQAANALQQGQIGSTAAGNVAGLVGSAATSFLNGPGTPVNLQTVPNSLGITAPSVNANPAFVNPLPSNPFGF